MSSLTPQRVRVPLDVSDLQEAALQSTVKQLQTAVNRAVKLWRRQPSQTIEATAKLLMGGWTDLPPPVAFWLTQVAQVYSGNTRGGLRGGTLPLNASLFQIDRVQRSAEFWTPGGPLTVTLRPGSFAQYLLRQSADPTHATLLHTRRGWVLRLDLSDPMVSEHDTATLELEGHFTVLRRALQARSDLDGLGAARLALSELLAGDIDLAELQLLRLSSQASVDARVFLGLSILAGRRHDAQRRLSEALRGLERAPDSWTRTWLMCSAARAHVELGQAEQALPLALTAAEHTAPNDLRGRARALYFLQGVYSAMDRYVEQERTAREALRLFDLLGVQDERSSLLLDLAYRRLLSNDVTEAHALLDQALSNMSPERDQRLPTAFLLRAEFAMVSGDFRGALSATETAQKMEETLRQDRLGTLLRAYALECRWRLGEIDMQQWFLGIYALRSLSAFDQKVVMFYRGLLFWHEGENERARGAFQEVREGLALLDSFRLRASAFLLDLDRRAGTLNARSPQQLLDLLDIIGGDLILDLDATLLSDLYHEIGRLDIGTQRLRRLMTNHESSMTVTVTTLGPFSVQIQDEPIPIRLSKSRELFVRLALYGPASREELQNDLWDGTNRPGLGSYFKQAVRSLRESFAPFMARGQDPVMIENGLYRMNPALDIQVDAAALLGKGVQGDVLTETLQQYKGPFLIEGEAGWIIQARHDLQALAVSACLELARAGDPSEAPHWFQRATDLDPLSDQAWDGLIESWESLGEHSQVRRTKLLHRLALERELGDH